MENVSGGSVNTAIFSSEIVIHLQNLPKKFSEFVDF